MDFKNRGAMVGHGWEGWAGRMELRRQKLWSSSNRRRVATGRSVCIGEDVLMRGLSTRIKIARRTLIHRGKPVTPQSLYLTQLARKFGAASH